MGKGQCRGFCRKGKGRVTCVEVIGGSERGGACVGACMCMCVRVCVTLIHDAGMLGIVLGAAMLGPREIDSEVRVYFRGSLEGRAWGRGPASPRELRTGVPLRLLQLRQGGSLHPTWTNHWCGLELG